MTLRTFEASSPYKAGYTPSSVPRDLRKEPMNLHIPCLELKHLIIKSVTFNMWNMPMTTDDTVPILDAELAERMLI